MTDTATPETGPVDAPASIESVTAEFEAGLGEAPADPLEEVTQELVNEAEGTGDSEQEPATEDDATDTAEVEAETPDEATQTEETEEPKYTVKVNGEEREVPLPELLNGYSRTEDYKAKTAAVAEERRQLEAQKANLEPELKAQYANQLEEATNLFAQFDPVLKEAATLDWEGLKRQNPEAFIAAQDAVNDRLAAIRKMNEQAANARSEAQQHQQQALERERTERFDKAAEEIVKLRPELADESQFKAFAGETVEFLKGVGFTGEEIVDALDHRVLTLADKARRWDAYEASRQALPEKKVVPKSAVKALTSDGSGSPHRKPRPPVNGSREAMGNWAVQAILDSE